MANVSITPANPTRAGVTPAYQTPIAADNYKIPNNGRVVLHVKNGATAGACLIATPSTYDGLAIPSRSITIAANTEYFIGPFPPEFYNDNARLIDVSFTTPTTITFLALQGP